MKISIQSNVCIHIHSLESCITFCFYLSMRISVLPQEISFIIIGKVQNQVLKRLIDLSTNGKESKTKQNHIPIITSMTIMINEGS